MKQTDLAYAAGIIDGEGCVTLKLYPYRTYPALAALVRVAMCDLAPLRKLKSLFGGSINMIPEKPPRRKQWAWTIQTLQARKCLSSLRPWLIVKHKQADIILGLTWLKSGGAHGRSYGLAKEREIALRLIRKYNKRGTYAFLFSKSPFMSSSAS